MTNQQQNERPGEWSPRLGAEPLQQGDIFAWKHQDKSLWKQYGIIVTADCDFAHRKHRDIVSYCPIVTLVDFVGTFWIPDDTRRAIGHLQKRIAGRLTAKRQATRPEFDLPVQPDVIRGWVNRRGPSGVADDVGFEPGSVRESVVGELALLQRLYQGSSEETRDALETLACAKLNNPEPTPDHLDQQLQRIWKDYLAKFRSLPGDLFFLNELGTDCTGGFLVYLRRVAEISPGAIAIRPSEARIRPAVRISRLRPPFRYRLTQQLAAMFADIGLPHEYEIRSGATLDQFAEVLRIKKS